MYSQQEIDDIKNKRRRIRLDAEGNEIPETSENPEQVKFEKENDVNELDKEFVDEMVKMKEEDEKETDPWLESLKTSETDETQKVYQPPKMKDPAKEDRLKSLYEAPRVGVIRSLVAKLEDGQTPSEYIKSKKESTTSTDPGDDPMNYDVSDLAHVLTMSWQNVYFMTREDIVDSALEFKNNDKERKLYEFRWVQDELAVHGPYKHEDILAWILFGYVSPENPILVRELDQYAYRLTLEWTPYMESDIYNIFPTNKESESETETKSTEEKPEGDANADKNNAKRDKEEDEDDDVEDEEGFTKRKKPKLIGLKPKDDKDKEEEYEESDEEHVD